MLKRIAASLAALAVLGLAAAAGATRALPARHTELAAYQIAHANPKLWHRHWWTNFHYTVAKGSFPAKAPGWGAYQKGWPDTATQRNYPVGGYYDPATTVWVSHHKLHIRMWRGTGAVHTAAVYPAAGEHVKYGRFIEVAKVVKVTRGYKSAHLLWPSGGNQNTQSYEVDYPENEWDTRPWAYVHWGAADHQRSFSTGVRWGSWHTYEIRWSPALLQFFVDGKRIGWTRSGVPHVKMDWVLQNESALNGESAPKNSAAQIDIRHVEYWTHR